MQVIRQTHRRYSIRVDRIVSMVNSEIKRLVRTVHDPWLDRAQRRILINLLEAVLNETGQNWGFHELTSDDGYTVMSGDDTAREYY